MPAADGFYVQLGAFSVRDNAERFAERMRLALGAQGSLRIEAYGSLHRVHAGPYADRDAALEAAQRIGESLGSGSLPVVPAR
jgi:rare lipoprotein A